MADVPRTSEVKVKEVKPISALSDQQSAGMSTGARPKQRPQSVTRETVLQAVPALSDPEEAGDSEWVLVMPALPQQLSEKGYRLIDTKPLSKGTAQLVYLLAGEAKDGFERSYFVVKFPCEASRARALQGLEIQEKLARLEDGDQYFVPVIEKVMENGQLICHVEPIGVPVMTHIDVEGLDLTQVFGLICRMLVAVGTMHAQGIAHLDIKPDNLVLETPDVETDMTARFCGDILAESAPINGEQYQRLGDFIMRKQRTLTRFAKQEAVDRTDVEDMLIDYLAEQGTLELLEEKNDSQLFGWLMTEWETRCRLQIFSHRLGQVC